MAPVVDGTVREAPAATRDPPLPARVSTMRWGVCGASSEPVEPNQPSRSTTTCIAVDVYTHTVPSPATADAARLAIVSPCSTLSVDTGAAPPSPQADTVT